MKSQDIAQLGFGFDDSPPNATLPKPKVTPRRGSPPVAPMAQSLDASPQLTDQPDRSDPQALGEVMACRYHQSRALGTLNAFNGG